MLAAGAVIAFGAGSASAGFILNGAGMQTVLSGSSLNNAALDVQTNTTWPPGTTVPGKPYTLNTGFAGQTCDNIATARLLMTVWGGTANYTCNLKVSLNGASDPFADITMGGTGDANPMFDGVHASVYGGGSGLWLVAVPVPVAALNKNGAANNVSVTVTTSDSFDGRIQQLTLASVYQKASLNNRLDYFIAEGTGDIYATPDVPNGKVDSRTAALNTGGNIGNVSEADLYALYTYGDLNQNDRLRFNGTWLGSSDVANKQNGRTDLNYVPDLVSFDVTGSLLADNSVTFSVSAADMAGTRETSLRPSMAALAVYHSVPEPGSVGLLALAGIGLLGRRRRTA